MQASWILDVADSSVADPDLHVRWGEIKATGG